MAMESRALSPLFPCKGGSPTLAFRREVGPYRQPTGFPYNSRQPGSYNADLGDESPRDRQTKHTVFAGRQVGACPGW